ncbi:MAG: dynamin family protein, partial [Desulfoprunum sp.]|nr:dynamin family protein [Desulfoprunum sp.]
MAKNEFETILDVLNDTIKELSEFDISGYVKKFKESDFFDELVDKIKDFQHDVTSATECCREAVQNPIYVGVIGHYSHGKSSLLNSLLFNPKAKPILPTGESIVTSLCTLIQFSEKDTHSFYEKRSNEDENWLDENEYQRKVSGKVSGIVKDVKYFRITLAAKNLAGDVFKTMAAKNIELLDTPGLGGPYWNDQYALEQWIKEFKLMIVCIKADKINNNSAAVVNSFLKHTSRPVIPVITFWDLWPEAEDYKGISDEISARAKAADLIKKYFTAISDFTDKTIFVSSKNYHEEIPVPSDLAYQVTEYWNIDNLRRALSSYIEDKYSILSKKPEESNLDRDKKELVVKRCHDLSYKFSGLESIIKKEIEKLTPENEFETLLASEKEKIEAEMEKEFDRIVDRLDDLISSGISAIPLNGKWNDGLSNIGKKVSNQYKSLIEDRLKDRIKKIVEKSLVRGIESYIEKETPTTQSEKKRINKELLTISEVFISQLNDSQHGSKIFFAPSGISDAALNITAALMAGIKDLFITNLPLAIGLIIAWPMLGIIAWLFPKVGGILFGVLIITMITIFLGRYKEALEKTCLEVKEKARDNNRRPDLQNRI